MEDLAVKLAETDARSRSNTKRIDKLEERQDALQTIAESVAVMANEQKNITKKVDDIDKKVDGLEQVPANRWNSVVEKIIMVIVAAIVGYILAGSGLF